MKTNLPTEVHDHFRKANVLHGYVQKDLAEATKHALEIGQELLAAKLTVPHGSWGSECERLFDGSLRTAQFYMSFAKHVSSLPKAQSSALLVLEGSLDGAAKAAKLAASEKPAKAKEEPFVDPFADANSHHDQPEDYPEGHFEPSEAPETPSRPDRSSESPEATEVPGMDAGDESVGTEDRSEPATGRESVSGAALVDNLLRKHAGPIARGLTEIAKLHGGEGLSFRIANDGLNQLIKGLQQMRGGEK